MTLPLRGCQAFISGHRHKGTTAYRKWVNLMITFDSINCFALVLQPGDPPTRTAALRGGLFLWCFSPSFGCSDCRRLYSGQPDARSISVLPV